MTEYVVRRMLRYVHDFRIKTSWEGGDLSTGLKDVEWTDLQRLGFRWKDRNAAARVAMALDAYVVRLTTKDTLSPGREKTPEGKGHG